MTEKTTHMPRGAGRALVLGEQVLRSEHVGVLERFRNLRRTRRLALHVRAELSRPEVKVTD